MALQVSFTPVLVAALALAVGPAVGQELVYVEPGLAGCAMASAEGVTPLAPRPVARGLPVPGRIVVRCGFEQGSYTVTLDSTDPAATFSPRTFLVNFGRTVGPGTFTVTFATAGPQRVSARITSNMGSPPLPGRFVGVADRFDVSP